MAHARSERGMRAMRASESRESRKPVEAWAFAQWEQEQSTALIRRGAPRTPATTAADVGGISSRGGGAKSQGREGANWQGRRGRASPKLGGRVGVWGRLGGGGGWPAGRSTRRAFFAVRAHRINGRAPTSEWKGSAFVVDQGKGSFLIVTIYMVSLLLLLLFVVVVVVVVAV